MRILMAIDNAEPEGGGAQSSFNALTRLLQAHGHEVAHFVLFDHRHAPPASDMPVYAAFLSFKTMRRAAYQFFSQPLSVNAMTAVAHTWAHALKRLTVQHGLRQFAEYVQRRFEHSIQAFQPDVVYMSFFTRDTMCAALYGIPSQLGVPSVVKFCGPEAICPARSLMKGGFDAIMPGYQLCQMECAQEVEPGVTCVTLDCITNKRLKNRQLSDFQQLIQSNVFKQVDVITAPSCSYTNQLAPLPLFNEGSIEGLYNAIDPRFVMHQPPATPPEKTYFLFAGRFVKEKGIWLLIDLFKHMPDIPLVMVGDGPEWAMVKHVVTTCGYSHIRILPWESHEMLLHRYKSAYAIVFPPLWYEAFGNVIWESALMGKAVIVSHHSGAAMDFLEHGVSGLLFDPGDQDDLRRCVHQLWADPELTQLLGQAARERVLPYAQADYTYEQVMKVFNKAIARYKARHQTVAQALI